MMHTATIEVAYVNEPKEGKKMGSVKTTDGEFYSVWPDKLANYIPGAVYEVEYTESEFKGKTYKTIKGVKSRTGPAAKAAGANAPARNGHTQSVEMFVMGTIGRSLQGTGTYPDKEVLVGWLEDAKDAWEMVFGPKQEKKKPELDDEIPF
jgi:hypothetical protein